VSEFFRKASTKPGQQELIKNYLYKCLTQEQHKRVLEIDDKINKDSGVLYKERTRLYNSVRDWEGSKKKLKLTEEEEKILQNGDKAEKRSEDIQMELSGIEAEKQKKDNLKAEVETLHGVKNRVKNTGEDTEGKVAEAIDTATERIEVIDENIDVSQERINELKEKKKKAKEYLDKYQEVKTKKSKYYDAVRQHKDKRDEYDDITNQIENLRKERMEIFKQSNLPETISIDEEGFKLDGYDFAETQVSESKAALAIAELLASISENKLITLGDGGMFNSERLKKLCKIAEKHGKFVALTRVVDGEDIKAVGIVE